MVLFSWTYNYLTYDRSTRAILTIAKVPITKSTSDTVAEQVAAQTVGATQSG